LSLVQTLYEILALIHVVLASVLALTIVPYMDIAHSLLPAPRIVLALTAAMAGGLLFARYKAVLAGLSRCNLVNGVSIVILLLRATSILVFLFERYRLVNPAAVAFATSIPGYASVVILRCHLLPGIRVSWRTAGVDGLQRTF
jgi:hypothetical protein